MQSTVFRAVERGDFELLAKWLVEVSREPELQCLHTWSGQSPAVLRGQLAGYWDDGELGYILATRKGRLVGAMGAEYDEELGRAWLHGPHVAASDWDALATELLARLLAELPASIGCLEAHLNVENARARSFYTLQGFETGDKLSYEFWLPRSDRIVAEYVACGLLPAQQQASFIHLYEAVFPSAYYSADRILAMIGHSHQVLVAAEAAELLGFIVLSIDQDSPAPRCARDSAAEIQFLGVREDRRGEGVGRRLLLSAIDWLFDQAQVSSVTLNVGEERIAARCLYESVGFQLRFTGIGLQRLRLAKSRTGVCRASGKAGEDL